MDILIHILEGAISTIVGMVSYAILVKIKKEHLDWTKAEKRNLSIGITLVIWIGLLLYSNSNYKLFLQEFEKKEQETLIATTETISKKNIAIERLKGEKNALEIHIKLLGQMDTLKSEFIFTLKSNNKSLRSSLNEVNKLLTTERETKVKNHNRIAHLEDLKRQLEGNLKIVKEKVANLKQTKQESSKKIDDLNQKTESLAKKLAFLESVKIKNVSIRTLNKKRNKTSNLAKWIYTQVRFELVVAEGGEKLENAIIKLRLREKVSGDYLPLEEGKMNSGTTEKKIQFKGNPVEIDFSNHDHNENVKEYVAEILIDDNLIKEVPFNL